MTFDHVNGSKLIRTVEGRWIAESGAVSLRADPPVRGLRRWFRALVMRRYADAMLKRTLRSRKRSGLDGLSPYLLKDVGLPPDVRL
jgi:hypothetical protein